MTGFFLPAGKAIGGAASFLADAPPVVLDHET